MFVEPYLQKLREERFRPAAVAEYAWKCLRFSVTEARHRPVAMRGVVLAGFAHLLVLLGIAVLLTLQVDRALALEYFVASSLWLLGGLAWISLHLGMFRHDRELPASGLGLPNFLTLGRLLAIPAVYLFLVGGYEILALTAFLLGGLTDVADGIAARRLGTVTRLGKVFDPVVDVLFNAAVGVALTVGGYLPGWLLAIILLRYGLLLFGAAYIYVFRGPVHVRPTALGKTMGVVTTGLVLGVVVVHRFVPGETGERIHELLVAALAFVFCLAVVQVAIIGWYNIRHLRDPAAPHGPLSVVVGEAEDRPDDGTHG
jgi:cardiolipin synthase